MNEDFDYIIVGADPARRVCLIEAGPEDTSALISTPLGVAGLISNPKFNWCFDTEPEPHVDGRRMFWPRGKTLGGSSSINAMVYIRGHAADYDDWAREVDDQQWSYDALLPLFREHENNERGPDRYHGTGGPLNVADLKDPNPLSAVFVQAAQQAGIPLNRDFNGPRQEGAGLYQVTQKNGQRWSSARAFLDRARQRPNLSVLTGSRVTRLLLEGRRAAGVELQQSKTAAARRELRCAGEVILCGGAVNSPQLLLLSGIGPADELARHGIPQRHELPGVGRNLQDHLDIHVTWKEKTRHAITLHPASLWRTLKSLWQYLRGHRGELTSNLAQAGGFLKSEPSQPIPDLQWHIVPFIYSDHGQNLAPLFRHYAYTLMTCFLRPESRGTVRLASKDPQAAPLIDANYLATERDMQALVDGLKQARKVLAQPAFAPHGVEEMEPGAAVRSDEQIRDYVRRRSETVYHPVGTCKMGRDAMAVVDARLRVHGLQGLRVVDASVMPTLVGGNTNAPTTMIAEKAADLILGDAALGVDVQHYVPEAASAVMAEK